MPQTILGIDVGSYSVKVAEVVRSFKSFAFVHFYERKIQFNEVLTRDESVTAAIQGVLEDNALTWEACYVALPGKTVATRFVDFPFGQIKKIDETVGFEVEDHVPFPMDDIVFDYHIIQSTKESSSVIVFYAQKAEFVKFLTLLGNAGVDPRRVCVEGVELVNLVHIGLVPPEAPYAIIDVGHEKTTITICHGKRLMYTRAVTIAGAHLTQAIAERLNISMDEAERLKHELGQVHVGGDWPPEDSIPYHVLKAIDGVLEELLLHVRQTFLAYRDRTREAMEGIYLAGGAARLPSLDQYLSVRLKQNVTFLNCNEFHFSHVDRAEAPAAIVPQALALALRGVAAAGLPDVNFRREEFTYRADVEQLGGGLRRAGIAAMVIVALACSYFFLQYFMLTRKAAQLDKEVIQLVTQALGKKPSKPITEASAAVRLLKTGAEDLKGRSKRFEALLNNSVLEVLKDISNQLPPRDQFNLDVDKLELKEGAVVMNGHTVSFEAVDKIVEAIGKSEKFVNLQKGNVGKGVKDEVKFELRFGVKGQIPPPPAAAPKGKGKTA